MKLPPAFCAQHDRAFITNKINEDRQRCLLLLPPANWAKLVEELRGWSAQGAEGKAMASPVLDAARELMLDSRGRIVIPQVLQEFAGLRGDAVMLDIGPGFEELQLWDPATLETKPLTPC